MCDERALRIDPVALGPKPDARQAEPDYCPFLVVSNLALEPDEASWLLQLCEQVGRVASLERAGEGGRGRFWIKHQDGIGIDRGRRIVGREQSAIAVDDVGAMPTVDRIRARLAADSGIAAPEGQIDDPERQGQQSQREHAADQP
jgi:hypothetical protein